MYNSGFSWKWMALRSFLGAVAQAGKIKRDRRNKTLRLFITVLFPSSQGLEGSSPTSSQKRGFIDLPNPTISRLPLNEQNLARSLRMKMAAGFFGEDDKDYMILGQHGQDFLVVQWPYKVFLESGSSSEQAFEPRPQIVSPLAVTTLVQFSLSPVDVNGLWLGALSFLEVIFSKQGYRKILKFLPLISLSN
jgi:hypothetical protein